MSSSVSVVIIDSDAGSAGKMEDFLKGVDQVDVAGVAPDLASGYDLVMRTRPMLVILDLDMDPEGAFGTMEKVLRQFPSTAVLATSSDSSSGNILRAMRSGATEFMLRPVDNDDLFACLKKVCRLMVPGNGGGGPAGSIITCFSPKGGMGNTTVAVNLAVCLHEATDKPVALVDLDLEGGDAAMFLNLKTKYTISDVTSNITRLDSAFLQGVMAMHSSGIYLLAEPQRVEEAGNITASEVREVLGMLKGMFAYVVVDTEIGYGERNLAALDSSDLVLTVGVLNLPALRNIQKALDVLDRIGFGRDKVKLVVNRYIKKGDITIDDAKKTLGCDVFHSLPNDFHAVMMSINRGQPLVDIAPHSEISRSFRDLAKETVKSLPAAKAGADAKTVFH